ncbi:MAG: cytochrome c-type biogenesis protein CcmH [Anaerolineales bacterium]|nr:cytochrome c-type biogenesis protein CcmH [Anaerolineales bacterium]
MKNISRWTLVLGVLVALLCLSLNATTSVSAQQPSPDIDNEVLRISKGLYCPVCTGVPLDVCETQACEQWRGLIREKLIAGESEAQIRQYFVAQYGERVLGAPPPEGFNLSVYILPALVLLVGAAILFWTARSWLKRPQTTNAPTTVPQVTSEYAERIARELKARE